MWSITVSLLSEYYFYDSLNNFDYKDMRKLIRDVYYNLMSKPFHDYWIIIEERGVIFGYLLLFKQKISF